MNEREVLAAADAVFDAERALRLAADTVDELWRPHTASYASAVPRPLLEPPTAV